MRLVKKRCALIFSEVGKTRKTLLDKHVAKAAAASPVGLPGFSAGEMGTGKREETLV